MSSGINVPMTEIFHEINYSHICEAWDDRLINHELMSIDANALNTNRSMTNAIKKHGRAENQKLHTKRACFIRVE